YYDNSGARPVFRNAANGTLRKIGSTGTLTVSGAYGGVHFENAGMLDIQDGELRVDSAHSSVGTAKLKITLGGPVAGSGYTRKLFGGTAQLGGQLIASFKNGYVPTPGTRFDVVTYGGRNGTFSTIALPTLSGPFRWKVNYDATSLAIEYLEAHALDDVSIAPDGSFQAELSGPAAASAALQATTNFVDWITVETVTPFDGRHNFVDPAAGSQSARFYRIQITE
ncbi:MAG TPA: hypothetical protein DCY13_05930, partial [Verrucomicrobiales bacterium]|nr:hypothetical protein [Verrucomicrobiales bacterium]